MPQVYCYFGLTWSVWLVIKFFSLQMNCNHYKIILFFLLEIAVCGLLAAQQINTQYRLTYQRWTPSDGLPEWKIYSYLQDDNHLLWLSTQEGLYTFDGTEFREVLDADVINKGGFIKSILQDKQGKIWMLRELSNAAEIEIFDPLTEEIIPLHVYVGHSDSTLLVQSLTFHGLSRDGIIWVGSMGKIYKYDGTWKHIFSQNYQPFTQWYPAKQGLWLANFNDREVVWYNEKTGITDTFSLPPSLNWVNSFADKDKNFYLHVEDAESNFFYLQLFPGKDRILNAQLSKLPKFEWFSEAIFNYLSNRLYSFGLIYEDRGGEYWLIDRDGKFEFNISKDYKEMLNSTPFYVDRSGAIWASNPSGLYRWEISENYFFSNYLNSNLEGVESTRGIIMQGDCLLAASYNGAKCVDLRDGSFMRVNIPGNKTFFCFERSKEGLWIGHSGTNKVLTFWSNDGTWQSYVLTNNYLEIFDLKLLDDRSLWIATNEGVYSFDIPSKTHKVIALEENSVFFIHENTDGYWLGTEDGLYLMDRQNNITREYLHQKEGLVYRKLSHIYEGSDGILWVTTSGAGLIKLDPVTGQYKQFTTAQGLSNDFVHAVYPDARGNLWMSSDFGLMYFDPITEKVKTFFSSDGTANNEYNFLSHYRSPDGRLYFGGVNGITSFDSDTAFDKETGSTPLLIVEAATFDLSSGSYKYQIKNGQGADEIWVKPTDSFLELEFSSMEFQSSNEIIYAWKIPDLQKDWILQKSPAVRLSNLSYGDHDLQYVAFRSGTKNEFKEYRTIKIHVVRPFFMTYPFWLTVISSMIGAFFFFAKWRTQRLRLENLKLERLIRARTQQVEQDRAIIAQQADDLRHLNEVKSRFFANITHELRTPIALILGPLEMMMDGRTNAETAQRHLSAIYRNAKRLLKLIEELLDLSKVEEKEQKLDLVAIRVYPFLNRVIEPFVPAAEQHEVTLKLAYDADQDLSLLLDQHRWEKIIHNLLSNALKFTPARGSVILTFQNSDGKYILRVADTGYGIATEDLPYVFDRFYQGGTVGNKVKGSGIGLSLVKTYCDLFDADLNVQSVPGKGTIFTIVFSAAESVPLVDAAYLHAAERKSDVPEMVQPAVPEKRPVVLLVEDEPDMQDFLVDVLHQEYELLLAQNGAHALKIMAGNHVDLVLSDVMMPEMDGLELLRQVKSFALDLPFILLTARADEQDKLYALTTGVDDYLTKPFKPSELLARLANLVTRYEIRQSLAMSNSDSLQDMRFDQQWLKQLEQLIRDNLDNPDFSVLMLAESMHSSERTLQYKTKAHTGLNPKQFIVEIRLNEGLRLLQTGTYSSIAEVCYAVGFKSTQYFAKLMKQRFGQTPSELLDAKNSI